MQSLRRCAVFCVLSFVGRGAPFDAQQVLRQSTLSADFPSLAVLRNPSFLGFAYSDPFADTANGVDSGAVYVRAWDADTDALVIRGSGPGARLGYTLRTIGDVDGSGGVDVGVSSFITAYVIDSLTGATVFSEAGAIWPMGDVDQDGLDDFLFDGSLRLAADLSHSQYTMDFTIAPTWVVAPTWDTSPFLVVTMAEESGGLGLHPDVTGDGIPDVSLSFHQAPPGIDLSQIGLETAMIVHSGADGSRVLEMRAVEHDQGLGLGRATFRDVTGDGLPELMVASRLEGDVCPAQPTGLITTSIPGYGVQLVDPTNGAAVGEICPPYEAWETEPGYVANWPWVWTWIGDANRDGGDDLLVGGYVHRAATSPPETMVSLLDGDSLFPIWTFSGTELYALGTVEQLRFPGFHGNLGDADGDGFDDLVGRVEESAYVLSARPSGLRWLPSGPSANACSIGSSAPRQGHPLRVTCDRPLGERCFLLASGSRSLVQVGGQSLLRPQRVWGEDEFVADETTPTVEFKAWSIPLGGEAFFQWVCLERVGGTLRLNASQVLAVGS